MIREEQAKRWREYVEELDSKKSDREVWRTIRNLDGRYGERKDNEALIVNGKAYIHDDEKAEKFRETYKKQSRIAHPKEDRELKKENRRFLDWRPDTFVKAEEEITMEELERAIRETRTEKAAGDDDIPHEFIKALGEKAKEYVLHEFNQIWKGEQVPQKWRTAVIKTLLKDGKDPAKTSSYRPISLTPCFGKVLEKIVASRMMSYLEKNKILNENQAGFRKERRTEDQILKLVQSATDELHKERGAGTIVTFFDFEKAFDKVWREGLINKMIKLGIPYRFISYVRRFLSARRTCVDSNGTRSRNFYLNDGLPQGSSISPILFLIFINDIDGEIGNHTSRSLFADDTAIWLTKGKDKEEAERRAQEAINKIEQWAEKWKMKLNGDKTEAMVIETTKSGWEPNLKLGKKEKKIRVVNEYKFLGVIIDSQLRFDKHLDKITTKAKKRVNIVKHMAGKDWGQGLETQAKLYKTYARSGIEYASPSYYPMLGVKKREKLETIQNEALRSMVGAARRCPADFLRLEAGIEPLEARMKKNNVITWERYRRLGEEDSRRKLIETEDRTRLTTRHGWRHKTREAATSLVFNREFPEIHIPPWYTNGVEYQKVKLDKKKGEYSKERLHQMTLERIAELDADIEIYTDGSTGGDQRDGGAGIYIRNRAGDTLEEISKAAGKICSSYNGETVAMEEATKWIKEQGESDLHYLVITDSMSMTEALEINDWKDKHEWIKQIKRNMEEIKAKTTVLWVPSHCGTEGNERADQLANLGAKMRQEETPVPFGITKAKIKAEKWRIVHDRAREMYGERRKPRSDIEKKWPRRIRSQFARLRTDHAKELKIYQKKIENIEDATCEVCGEGDETIKHVLCQCPGLADERRKLRSGEWKIQMMVTEPEICRKLLQQRFHGLREKTPSEDTRGEESGGDG